MDLHQTNDRDTHACSVAVSQDALNLLKGMYAISLSQMDEFEPPDPVTALARLIQDLVAVHTFGKLVCGGNPAWSANLEIVIAGAMTDLVDMCGVEDATEALAQAIDDIDYSGDEDEDEDEDEDKDEDEDEDECVAYDGLASRVNDLFRQLPELYLLKISPDKPAHEGMYYAAGEGPDPVETSLGDDVEACDDM